jgi:hypothetical protein
MKGGEKDSERVEMIRKILENDYDFPLMEVIKADFILQIYSKSRFTHY